MILIVLPEVQNGISWNLTIRSTTFGGNMAIKASVLSGPTNLMAGFHPFAGPAGPYTKEKIVDGRRRKGGPVGGVPIMIDIRTKELIMIEPWLLKDAGVIHSAYGIILGPKGHGKSSCLKIIAHRLALLTAGYDTMRIAINDYKPEGKSSEYDLFARRMQSTPFLIANMQVNPFESRLFASPERGIYALGILRMAEIFAEFAHGKSLIGLPAEALRVGVAKMITFDEALWSPQLLFVCLRSITLEDVATYNRVLRDLLLAQLTANLSKLTDKGLDISVGAEIARQITSISTMTYNIHERDIAEAGVFVSTLFGNILHGSMGELFGNKHSLYNMLTQRAATMDWRGVSPEAETLMRIILTAVKIAAIENNRLDLLPHIELDDEKHKAMENPVYAKSHSYMSEIARATHNCNLSATHRLSSIRKGGVGSELYQLGDTVINNLGFQLIGKHENDPTALEELRVRYGLSETDMQIIPSLPDYTFGIRLGDQQRIRYGRVFALPSEVGFLSTNTSNDRMIDRPGIISPDRLRRFADENKIVYLGQDVA
jgi:hypothetical protein